jgi:predicted RND superfamily exporter protein
MAVKIRVVAGWLAALALIVGGCLQVKVDTSVQSFLPSGDSAASSLTEKAQSFGADPVIVLLQTSKPRAIFTSSTQLLALIGLEGKLSKLPNVAAVYGPGTVLNQIAGAAQNMLAQIFGRGDGYRQTAIAEARAKGESAAAQQAAGNRATQQFDERYGSLLVQGLPAGLPTVKNPQFVNSVLFDSRSNPRQQWHYIIPTTSSVAILIRPRAYLGEAAASQLTTSVRQAVAKAGLTTSKVTVTGTPVLSSALTNRAKQEAPLLGGLAVAAVTLIFLLMPWSRRRRDRIRPTLSAILGTAGVLACFGWAHHQVSLGVVAFLPILLGIGSDFPLYLWRGRHTRRILVAAAAAAVGFASLLISPLPLVRELGLALSLGLILTVAGTLAVRRSLGNVDGPISPAAIADELVPSAQPLALGWRVCTALVAVGVASIGWILLPSMTIEAQPEALAKGLPELASATYAENTLGSNGEVSVLLKGKNLARPEVLAWSRSVESKLVQQDGDVVHPVLSMGDLFAFLGSDPTQGQFAAALTIVPHYLSSAVLNAKQTEALMIFGVQFSDVHQLASILSDMRGAIASPPAGVQATVVGLPVAASRGLQLMSQGRLLMNIAGIVLAGLVILIGLRPRDAFRAVLTVGLATGWVVALAALTSASLSPLTVAVGSLTTATGCEFALMLSGRRSAGMMREVGTAALAGTTGYLVLGLSELALLRDFGLLLGASVACSFLAALVVTRVLLVERETTSRPDDLKDEAPELVPHGKVLA